MKSLYDPCIIIVLVYYVTWYLSMRRLFRIIAGPWFWCSLVNLVCQKNSTQVFTRGCPEQHGGSTLAKPQHVKES